MSSKKDKSEKTTKKESKEKASSTKETKKSIPKEWKDKELDSELEKGKRRSLISALRRSISVKGDTPGGITKDPMNIVITLSPAKHLDLIEYLEENVAAGGRAEWVRDSMRLKLRIEKGVYGLNTGSQEGTQKGSEEALQSVMGQFAEVMTKVMTDLKATQPSAPRRVAPIIEQDEIPLAERPTRATPPVVKKIDSDESKEKEIKPDRPSLDDAMSAIIVVQ